ncbi:MAG TPA: phospholipase D family protein [Ramlibacter sp.]|nr:phospholipase D family protein [Ramlibacter sp.]
MGSISRPAGDATPATRRNFLLWRLAAALLLSSWAAGCASLPSNPPERARSQSFATPEQTPLGRLAQARRAQADARSETGFFLLDSVDAAFSSRVALIESATRTLDLQYYAIHADASTEILLQRIREAARRGVRVRILLDDFNSVGDDAQVLRLGFEQGVEIRLFNPLPGSRGSLLTRVLGSLNDVSSMQKRMHNKLFIADNAWGIAGGRNLGDAYFGGDGKSSFVDLDVLATGQLVRQMSASFDRFWNDELAYPMQALLTPKDLEKLRGAETPQPAGPAKDSGPAPPPRAPAPLAGAPPSVTTGADKVLPDVGAAAVAQAQRPALDLGRLPLTWAPSALMVDRPEKIAPGEDEAGAGETVVDGLLSLIGQAREEVLVISPYFVPGARMMAVFEQAIARGVRLRVLTNSLASNDAPAAHAGYARYRPQLLKMGVQLYEMRADPQSAADPGISNGSSSKKASGLSLGSATGGSKSGSSRASLHSKAVIIDRRIAVIGSMNLDLRSTLQNSEVALIVRSAALSREAARLIEGTLAAGAYRIELDGERLHWRAPPGAPFGDAASEPEASFKLRLLVKLLSPFAPDEML